MKLLTLLDLGRLAYPQYQWARHHQLIAQHLHRVAAGQIKRLLICTPPQFGKSTLISRLFPAWLLMLSPASKLIALSYDSGLVEAHSETARDIVKEFGPRLTGVQVRSDTRAKSRWSLSGTAGGSFSAMSIGSGVTGRAADLLILDDLYKNDLEANSPLIRSNIERTFSSAAETRLSPDGAIVYITTRWHPSDLPSQLLDTEKERWTYLRLPLFADGPDDPLGRQEGEVLWPERYPQEWCEAKRASFEVRGLSYLFNALYQANPTGDGSNRTIPEHMLPPSIFYSPLKPPYDQLNQVILRVMAVDPSLGKNPKSDYSAIVEITLVKHPQGAPHLFVDADLQRRPIPKLEADTLLRALQFMPQAIAMEANGFQQTVVDNVKKLLASHHMGHVRVDGLVNTFGGGALKPRVAISLVPLFEQGRIHIADTPGGRLLYQQLREYPTGAHDDGPDALELGTQLINLLLTGQRRPNQQVVLQV